MKLKPNINITLLLEQAKSCEGDITFQSAEGDILNLKSTLSAYIFATITDEPDLIKNGEIICQNTNDYKLLSDYVILTV